jgi:soluble lytic murein transglycosylase-like protein
MNFKTTFNKLLHIFFLVLPVLNAVALNTAVASVQNQPDEQLRQLLKEAVSASDSFSSRFDAEVWLLDMSERLQNYVPENKKRLELLKAIHYEATRVNLQPELVLAVIHVESRFNRWAISNAGAQGLMQIMPFWLKEIGRPRDNLFDIETNLRLGCTILRYYLDKEKGNLSRALARYNGSLGSFKYPNLVFNALRTLWFKR